MREGQSVSQSVTWQAQHNIVPFAVNTACLSAGCGPARSTGMRRSTRHKSNSARQFPLGKAVDFRSASDLTGSCDVAWTVKKVADVCVRRERKGGEGGN